MRREFDPAGVPANKVRDDKKADGSGTEKCETALAPEYLLFAGTTALGVGGT